MSVHDARGANGSATIECISPASEIMTAFAERSGEPLRLSAAPFPLSVAPDGASFAPSSLAFTFYVPPVPEVHSPTSGPLAGGTSVTVTGAFPRMLFASTTDHVDASSFPEAACQFAGARVPASVLPIVDNSTAVAEELLTLNAPPPPLAPPPPFDASNSHSVVYICSHRTMHKGCKGPEQMLSFMNSTSNSCPLSSSWRIVL